MANRTIGGSQNLDSMDIDHYKSQQEQQSLAIWDYDESIKHTRRISPKNLIDNSDTVVGLGNEIDNIKKDLGGDPYIAFSTDWGKETEDKYPSIYDDLSNYTYPTSAEKEIRYIEADIKDLKDNINNQIKTIKKDLGYVSGSDDDWTYHGIYSDSQSPTNYQSAYLWLNSLQSKIPRLGTWEGAAATNQTKGNAYDWLKHLDKYLGTWQNPVPSTTAPKNNTYNWLNHLDKYLGTWTGAATTAPKNNTYNWLQYLQTKVDGIEKIHEIPRTKWVDLNKEAQYTKYTFRLQPDGNIVFYRTKNNGTVQSDRNWVWQSGPQYSPAIFKVTAEYTCNASAGTFTGANSGTLTVTSTSNPNIEIGGVQYNYSNASIIVPYLSTGRAVSILAVKNVNTTDYSINDITITPSRHAIKLIGVQKKNNGNKPIQLRLICCDDNNIPDPSYYQNDPYDNNGNRS